MRDHADEDLSAPLTLHARDFRCFERLAWRLPDGPLLLHGGNGAGKSSLVEALYLAVTSRSFRTTRLDTCTRAGCDGFALRVEVGAPAPRTLAFHYSKASGRARSLDGREAPLAEQLRLVPLLVWWQGESAVVTGPPLARRRFFDRATIQIRPTHLAELGDYSKALDGKRALLARGDRRSLADWNRLLARHGARIAAARALAIEQARSALARLGTEVDAGLPELSIDYRPSPRAALDGEEALAAAFERLESDELRARRPLAGAQRDEIELVWGGAPAREVASAGERKAIGLLLVAAQAELLMREVGRPLLLLDDADAELDPRRLERLVALLSARGRLVATTNRPTLWGFAPELAEVAVGALATAPADERLEPL